MACTNVTLTTANTTAWSTEITTIDQDLVLCRSTWHPVVQVNTKSVSVPSRVGGSRSDTVRYAPLRDVANVDDPRRSELNEVAPAAARPMFWCGDPLPAWDTLR
jgi:hypothetical protein